VSVTVNETKLAEIVPTFTTPTVLFASNVDPTVAAGKVIELQVTG
jgi:hypothetical protein